MPEFPVPADLADEWLADALGYLLDACELPREALGELLGPAAPAEFLTRMPAPSDDPAARRKRLDAARLAVVIAALAVETRLNRVLKLRDPSDWSTMAHLAPLEKFQLAPRLLRDVESAPAHSGLSNLAFELLELRAELVDAGVRPTAGLETADEPDLRFMPRRARTMVVAGARICEFLATLAGRDDETGMARLVDQAAGTLDERAEACSLMGGPIPARRDWGWDRDVEFPPDIVGS
jgi:hypothetical protein